MTNISLIEALDLAIPQNTVEAGAAADAGTAPGEEGQAMQEARLNAEVGTIFAGGAAAAAPVITVEPFDAHDGHGGHEQREYNFSVTPHVPPAEDDPAAAPVAGSNDDILLLVHGECDG